MKQKATPIIIAVLLLAASAWALGMIVGEDEANMGITAKNRTGKIYIASGHPEWPPFMWKENDKIVGAGQQLVSRIGDDLGINIESNYVGLWDGVQAKAKSGEVDLLVAAYKTQEREGYMEYSQAYAVDPVALFIKKGRKFSYNEWKDLIGKRGVATVGDSYGQEFDGYIKAKLNVKRVDTAEAAFNMVEKGTADYFIYALYSGEKAMKTGDLKEKIEIVPKYVSQENFYVTVSKKSNLAKRMDEINKLLEKYKQDGTIDKMIEDNRRDLE